MGRRRVKQGEAAGEGEGGEAGRRRRRRLRERVCLGWPCCAHGEGSSGYYVFVCVRAR